MNSLSDKLFEEFRDKEYAHTYADEFLNAYIATQIKALRQQQNLSQEELATLAEMKQERISVLEDVNYSSWSVKTLKRLARAFDLTLTVSFEAFSTRIGDISNFNRKYLERKSRTADLFQEEEPEILQGNVTGIADWANQNQNRRQSAGDHPNPFSRMSGNEKHMLEHHSPNEKNSATSMAAGASL